MPIYEYKCRNCGEVFEQLSFSSDGEGTLNCPACGSTEAEKLLSAFCSVSGGSSKTSAGSAAPSHSCGSHGGFS